MITLQLDLNLNLVRRDTQVTTSTTSSSYSGTQTASNTNLLISQSVLHTLSQYFQEPTIVGIEYVSSEKCYDVKATVVVNKRTIPYSVKLASNNGQYEIVDSNYAINFTPSFTSYNISSSLKTAIDELIRQVLKQNGKNLPQSAFVWDVLRDEPLLQFIYCD